MFDPAHCAHWGRDFCPLEAWPPTDGDSCPLEAWPPTAADGAHQAAIYSIYEVARCTLYLNVSVESSPSSVLVLMSLVFTLTVYLRTLPPSRVTAAYSTGPLVALSLFTAHCTSISGCRFSTHTHRAHIMTDVHVDAPAPANPPCALQASLVVLAYR